MMTLLLLSAVFSIRYLSKGQMLDDLWAIEFANTAILFGILGCITGSVWAYFAWGGFLAQRSEDQWGGGGNAAVPGLFYPSGLF